MNVRLLTVVCCFAACGTQWPFAGTFEGDLTVTTADGGVISTGKASLEGHYAGAMAAENDDNRYFSTLSASDRTVKMFGNSDCRSCGQRYSFELAATTQFDGGSFGGLATLIGDQLPVMNITYDVEWQVTPDGGAGARSGPVLFREHGTFKRVGAVPR